MAGTSADRSVEHSRARSKETNNYPEGRSGSGPTVKTGPAARGGVLPTAKTMGGGINEPLKRGNR